MKSIQEDKYDAEPLPAEMSGRIRAHIRFVRKAAKLPGSNADPLSASLLDAGCASGALLLGLSEFKQKSGVDISAVQVAAARSHGLDVERCDLEEGSLPFDDGQFDVVCAFDVIEHVLHTDHAINELNRVLRVGGVFVGSVPNIYQPLTLLMMLRDLTPMYASRYRSLHVRDFTLRLFHAILRKHGFQPKRCSGTFVFPFENASWSHRLADWFPRLGSLITVGAIKEKTVNIPDGFSRDMDAVLDFLRPPE